MAKPKIEDRLIVKTMEDVARVFNITHQAVSLWKQNGMPVLDVGGEPQYDLDDIYLWKVKVESALTLTRKGQHKNPFVNAALPQVDGLSEKIDQYRLKRSDIFAARQMTNLAAQDRIKQIHVDELTDEAIREWDHKQALAWYGKLGLDAAIWYDKEDLERNKGVEDVSKVLDVIAKIKEIERGD